MSHNDKLSRSAATNLTFRLLFVGAILGPIALGTVFTSLIYISAVAGGENPVSQLMLFPFGWMMAFVFAGIPAVILSVVLLVFRGLVGPWTKWRLFLIIFPLCWLLSALLIRKMMGAEDTIVVLLISSLFYALLGFAIILFFWGLRGRLGLAALGSILQARSSIENPDE